jgi:hypothetical protein
MSDNISYPLTIALEIRHLITRQPIWASQQQIYLSRPFKINKEEGILKIYLKIFKTFPAFLTHDNCSIYKAYTLYWGKHLQTDIEGFLIKTPSDDPRHLSPATPQPSGSYSVQYSLLLLPHNTPLPPNFAYPLQPLRLLDGDSQAHPESSDGNPNARLQ